MRAVVAGKRCRSWRLARSDLYYCSCHLLYLEWCVGLGCVCSLSREREALPTYIFFVAAFGAWACDGVLCCGLLVLSFCVGDSLSESDSRLQLT